MKKILKDNRGSITTVVTVTVLFFSVILSTAYMITSTNRKTQLKSEAIAKETYEKPFDNLDKIREEVTGLPKTDETQPYFPSSEFKRVNGTNLSNGLVIEDGNGNQYVWVEVPKNKTVYPTAGLNIVNFTDDEYTKIENDLHTYTSVYRNTFANENITIYTDTWTKDTANSNAWYTETQYYEVKKKMLKSIYQNGGFYVGRYETGIDADKESGRYYDVNDDTVYATTHATTQKPVIKANAYPYNWIQRAQALELAQSMEHGTCTSSLLFGVQWDLILAFMHNEGNVDNSILTSDSKGNYLNTYLDITGSKARYSLDLGKTYKLCPYKKDANTSALFTTGIDSSFSMMNIFDIGGNVFEWTLEGGNNETFLCTVRGGGCWYDNTSQPMSTRYPVTSNHNHADLGFRITIF